MPVPPVSRAPWSTQCYGGRTHYQVHRARRVLRPLAQLQGELPQRDRAARRSKEAPCALAGLWMAQRTVFRSPDHKTMAEFLATHQVFIDVGFAISHPDPPDACWRVP